MINKLVSSDSYDFGDLATHLVPLHRGGVDGEWMRKHASSQIFTKELADLKPQSGKTVLHIIALGDEETYGKNRNCDAFSREDNKLAHATFKKLGHVFRNHKNSDPANSVGEVLATGHNDEMGRVELLIALNNNKCAAEVEAINDDKDVPFSMGSSQEYDVCSICKHKAPTASDHCDHVKDQLGEVLKDGRSVYMKNPNPKFFDISIVHKPADRIAYSLRKVASTHPLGGHDLAEMYGVSAAGPSKVATMHALAEIVKEIPATARRIASPIGVRADTKQELKKLCSAYGVDQVMGLLSKKAWLLSPEDFAEVIVGHSNPKMAVDDACGCGLSDIIDDHEEIPAFDAPVAQERMPLSEGSEVDLNECCGMGDQPALRRTLITSIQHKAAKLASGDVSEVLGLSMLYKHYKVAFAHAHRSSQSTFRSVASTF